MTSATPDHTPAPRLAGRVAFVTGGARGIGRAIVERFLAEGAHVAIADLDEAGGSRLAELHPGVSVFARCDVSREADVAAAVAAAETALGTIDVLVNNAGVNAYHDPVAMSEQEWDDVMAVDLKGAWLCAKHVLPGMRRLRRGSIVNIGSIHAVATQKGMFPYAAAKCALDGLTRGLALEYGAEGIRANCLRPGFVRTHLVEEWIAMHDDPAAAERGMLAAQPLGRIAEPSEIAAFAAFLASDDASFVTAASLMADGGLSAKMSA